MATGQFLKYSRAIAVATSLVGHSIAAQNSRMTESNNSERSTTCERVASEAVAGSSVRDAELLLEIRGCETSGPVTMAKIWENPPSEMPVFDRVLVVSSNFADRRLLKQLATVAQDGAMPLNSRIGAMGVMGSFIDPRLVMSVRQDAGSRGVPYVGIGMTTHPPRQEGSEPLTDADRALIREIATKLATSDPNNDLGAIAKIVLKRQ